MGDFLFPDELGLQGCVLVCLLAQLKAGRIFDKVNRQKIIVIHCSI